MADANQNLELPDCRPDYADLVLGSDWLTRSGKLDADKRPPSTASRLVLAIETEIIPRLLLARRERSAARVSTQSTVWPAIQTECVRELAALVLEDGTTAASYIDALRGDGVSIEHLYLRLLGPVARRLGELWDADRIDFTQVTLGVGRLQLLLRRLSPDFLDEMAPVQRGRRILLLPVAGEQHSFGLIMVAEFFRRGGWEVTCDLGISARDVDALVREQPFALVGFSLGSAARLDALAAQIRATRRASMNRSVGVMVGGNVFEEHPDFVARIGADATAADGRQALARAEDMLGLLAI
jgi:methanogenic corrinoid protein MtbC1